MQSIIARSISARLFHSSPATFAPSGTVKWFNVEKGFGFITPDDGSGDIFVHHTGIAGDGFRSLREGELCTYELTEGRKGQVADNVVIQEENQSDKDE
eukprot:JP447604.1.p1 GENE.JP447604.1~~JP447604.1.p1  ORF type:complete len:98 (+),score=38.63 JP447604.1:56-349(+)